MVEFREIHRVRFAASGFPSFFTSHSSSVVVFVLNLESQKASVRRSAQRTCHPGVLISSLDRVPSLLATYSLRSRV